MDIMYIFIFVNLMSKNSGTSEAEYTLPGQLYFLVSELPIRFPCLFFCLQLPHFDHKSSHNILSTWLCASHCTRCFKIVFFLETTHFTGEKYKKHGEEIQTLVFFTGLFYSKGCTFSTISLYQKASFYRNRNPKGKKPTQTLTVS